VALVAFLVVAYGVSNGIARTRAFHVLRIARDTAVYASGVRWLESRTPPGSPVVAMQFSGALFYSSERPLLRWDTGDPSQLGRVVARSLRAGSRPHALLFDFEVDRLHARHPGLFVEMARRPPVVLLAAAPRVSPAIGELDRGPMRRSIPASGVRGAESPVRPRPSAAPRRR
jgi:hypothetical protein